MRSALRIVWLAAFLAACGSGDTSSPAPASPPGPPRATVLNTSLASPWGMAFLPDGRMLVTQKGGSMVMLSADGAKLEATVSGVPAVVASGQGGLLDVVLDPEFDPVSNPWVYWSYSEWPATVTTVRALRSAPTAPCSSRSASACTTTRPTRGCYTRRTLPTISARSFASTATAACRPTIRISESAARCRRSGATVVQRIRNVRHGPGGWIYLLTDSGKLIRIER